MRQPGTDSDKYFVRGRGIVLLAGGPHPLARCRSSRVRNAVVAGTDEAIAILKLCLTRCYRLRRPRSPLAARRRPRPGRWESVNVHPHGPYAAFVHLDDALAGVLGRRNPSIAPTTRSVVEAAWPRSITFFPARHDHWMVQTGDGWAAHVAGAIGVSTDAQASWWGSSGTGTVPHGLIAAFGGDTVAATRALAAHLADEVQIVSLVDFDNDSVATSLAVARAMGERLWGVRLDTSGTMVDRSMAGEMGDFDPRGVNPDWSTRSATASMRRLRHVCIVASGGLTPPRSAPFEEAGVRSTLTAWARRVGRILSTTTADIALSTQAAVESGRWNRPTTG